MSAEFLRVLERASRGAGLEPARILAQSGIDREVLEQRGTRLPVDAARHAWRQAALESGDPLFGLHAAERMPLGALDVIDYLTRASATVGAALATLIRYLPLFVDTGDISLACQGDVAVFTHRGRATPACVTELLFALILQRSREFSGIDWSPREVRLRHGRLAPQSPYEEAFASRVRFRQQADQIVLDRALLELPLRTADPVLLGILEVATDQTLSRVAESSEPLARGSGAASAGFAREFEQALRECLLTGDPGIERVADRLGLSRRTLQRRLDEHDTSHSAVLKSVRLELAERMLAGSDQTQGELARALGYSSASSFQRAFKRWRGRTPRHH